MADELAEFNKNFEYCFFRAKLKIKREPRAFLLTHVDRTAKTVHGKLVTSKLTTAPLAYDYNSFVAEAEPIVPLNGYLNCQMDRPTAIFLQVTAERQYRKALFYDGQSVGAVPNRSPKNVNYLVAKGEEGMYDCLIKSYAHQLAIDPIPRFYTIRNAVDLVDTGVAHSCAISRFFSVSLDKMFSCPVLWHRQSREGVIINGNVYVTDKILPFKDFFRKKWDINIYPIMEAPKL